MSFEEAVSAQGEWTGGLKGNEAGQLQHVTMATCCKRIQPRKVKGDRLLRNSTLL